MIRWRVTTLWAFLMVVLLVGACSGSDSEGGADTTAQVGRAADESAEDEHSFAAEQEGEAGGGGGIGASAALVPRLDQAVIKDASLDVEVRRGDLDEAVDAAVTIASAYGGFVLTSALEEAGGASATLRLRVPSPDFEAALSDLKDLGKLRREGISGRDVTEEFVDLEARLRNLEAQERVLLSLMDRATTVAASIRVQRELTPVQLDIERIRGRMRFLEDRTSFGTISLHLEEAGAVTAEEGPLARAWARAVAAFVAVVSGLIVAAGYALPLGAIALVLALLARLMWRRAEARS